jgi:hypothetical protein
MKRRSRRSRALAAQSIALGMAVPQVIAHRAARMGDHAELFRMGSEKVFAFHEAWVAMATQAVLENQKLAFSLMQSGLSIFGKGMAPVRRRAVANAKRLGRARRR